MPLIRYDRGDSALLAAEPCPCGSAYPALRITGRKDDLLALPARNGQHAITLAPLSLVTVIEGSPGVYRVQVIHHKPADREIRLQLLAGADPDTVWSTVRARVRNYFDDQGVGEVELRRSSEPPIQHQKAASMSKSFPIFEPTNHRSRGTRRTSGSSTSKSR